ncbi:ABC transporter ATP-binding protein [Roseospira visakhapatnamensis]|uniref:Glycerol transport system ATP-binding protein n=1 Tax=Roseospira visakhapatnamensis TaxID=390880 RepID=A0A7W6RD61_9PROT|nr:ABC transporter ATP-binding protein [Roseospira visakhapatnamensis]MBB4266130.1 glycerol transport system ATP-binding protein [Roseospira visakhapatnamensis]
MARIDLRGLAHSYRPAPRGRADYALKRMDMTWRDGGAYALLGPSGCGKTTLLNIISGLLVPSQGQVLFDDEDVTDIIPEDRNIAQVFQFPVIYDTMTVRQNLEFPLRNRRVPEPEIAARVAEIAEALHMTDDLPRKARGLTADAKQKISLGRGLVRRDTAAILFDEPLTVIDPHLKWLLRSQLKDLHRRYDFTMIYVTHDQTEALTFADSVVVMHEGAVVQVGTPTELFERPAHTFVGYFIGSPGMNVLPCEITGASARVGHQTVPLARGYAPSGGKVELGVRPEFVRVDDGPDGLAAQVTDVEDVGRYRIARLRLEGHPMAAILPDGARLDGHTTRVGFDPAHVNVYVDDHLVEGEA